MGELIQLSERLADRSRPSASNASFFFALDDPLSYLTAERVERALGPVDWVPVIGPLSEGLGSDADEAREHLAAERLRAAEHEAEILQLPLVEPHRFPMNSRRAARAAAFAADAGCGAQFTLALMRLAFCGGFDITAAPVLEEAAATAGLDPEDAVTASRDRGYDLRLDATSRGLLSRGVKSPPAISIGRHFFYGSDAVIAAVSFSAALGMLSAPERPAS